MTLALGTVQFGLAYGIANKQGQVSLNEAKAILELARAGGIDTLDTAMVYGDSEQRLGAIGIEGWQVVSKLPPVPEGCEGIAQWVMRSVQNSLNRMKAEKLHALLLHRPQQLLEENGDQLYRALLLLKQDGLIEKIGVSIYAPSELDELCRRYDFDLVQAPFNIMDRRLVDTGWMCRLNERKIELHVRSAFLQGLLLMNPGHRPKKFDRWASLWTKYDSWLRQTGLTPLQACLGFSLSFLEISKVIVGVDSRNQMKEILEVTNALVPSIPAVLATDDLDLIDPTRWDELS